MKRLKLGNGRVVLYHGSMLEVLERFPDNYVDSIVCDPPYHLTSIVKRFSKNSVNDDNSTGRRAKNGSDGMARLSRGFFGKKWDGGDIAFDKRTWRKLFRVLKPGGHLVAFAATRNQHRMVCAIEDAGFEIRDSLMWCFSAGFPKSQNVSKRIDVTLGAKRKKIRIDSAHIKNPPTLVGGVHSGLNDRPGRKKAAELGYHETDSDEPASDEAAEWNGWGTALKPAHEVICLARKPLSEKTVAKNVLKWGTGAINIDGCRIKAVDQAQLAKSWDKKTTRDIRGGRYIGGKSQGVSLTTKAGNGRWPPNVLLERDDDVIDMFPTSKAGGKSTKSWKGDGHTVGSNFSGGTGGLGDSGSAARFFFYSGKANKKEKNGSSHPTIKPVALMQWLVRMVTPPNGIVLDPFAGTGTTGEAARREHCRSILIEREKEYCRDIVKRIKYMSSKISKQVEPKIDTKIIPRVLFARK